MKTTAPDYYASFKCTAGDCKHNCCIGWEIDIDADTISEYETVTGNFGKRLKENISFSGDIAYFKLTENERCPFLNPDGLCDIILTLGEDSICQICTDHPRFRNFFPSRTEIGLGLCCEAAARLILLNKEKVRLIVLQEGSSYASEYENSFIQFRDRIIDILQNRSDDIDTRVRKMLKACGSALPQKSPRKWAEIFLELERLDPIWSDILNKLKSASDDDLSCSFTNEFDTVFEQLLVYFTYRHLSGAYNDGRIAARAAFSALSLHILRSLAALNKNCDFVDLCRLYSSEIEYSEENLSVLLDILET